MIRTIEKAIERLKFRLENGRYDPNKTDLETVNFIIEWSNNCKLSALQSSELTKKLLIHFFSESMYKTKGDPIKAQKLMAEVLSKPYDFLEEQFCKTYDDYQVFRFLDNNDIPNSKIDKDGNIISSFEQLTPDKQKEFEEIFMMPDRSDKVLKSLRNTLAEFLIKYSR